MVGQQDRLAHAAGGPARHGYPKVACRPARAGVDHLQQARRPPGEHPKVHPISRDLVVARAAGPEPPAELGADQLDEPTLQRPVHVLVTVRGPEASHLDLSGKLADPVEHAVELLVGQQPGPVQRPGMRCRAGQIVRREAPVELGGPAEREHGAGRPTLEPAAPQPPLVISG